jgi:glycosyltransferase involved in cell wall biosynthesis
MGGMETYCVRLTQELARDVDLDVVALPGRADGGAPGVLAMMAFGIKTAFGLMIASRAAVVHLGDVSIWPLGLIARLRHPGTAVIITAHGSDLSLSLKSGLPARLYRGYVRLGARLLGGATVVAVSGWLAGLARDAGFERVTTIPNASDIAAPATHDGAHNGALFFAGRIMRRKGLSRFIDTVLPLLPAGTRIRVAGTVWDAAEARILTHPQVDFLGALGPAELAREYRGALAVIVPSIEPEGFGLVAAEAAMAGGVVIAADHSGLRDAVLADTGFLASIDAPDQWGAAIADIAGWNAGERAAFTRTASASALERFSWRRVAAETGGVYQAALRR